MAAITAVASIASLGYGIYAGDRAQKAQQRQYDQARQDSLKQQQDQAAMLSKQQADAAALADKQSQEQAAAQAAQQKMQQDALTQAQSQIPVIQGQLGQNLQSAENLSLQQTNPILESRLNALGLLQSGALPEAQAKYRAQLDQQRQNELAQYGMSANQAIQNQALGYAGTNAGYLQQNLGKTLSAQQLALQNQDQSAQQAFMNNVAQQQYLSNMGSQQNQMAAQQGNQFVNLGGQLAGAGMYMYGQGRSASQPPSSGSPTSSSGSLSGIYTSPQGQPGANYFDPYSGRNASLGALQYSRQAGLFGA